MDLQISTLMTIVLNKVINTGDRLLDGALVSMSLILVTYMIHVIYNNARRIYNRIIYIIYRQYKTPWDVNSAPYLPQITYTMTLDMFIKTTTKYRLTYSDNKQINNSTMETFHFHTNPYIRINDSASVVPVWIGADGGVRFNSLGSGLDYLHLAGFTRSGYEIFISSTGAFYSFDMYQEVVHFATLFCDEFIRRAKGCTESSSRLDICSPIFSEKSPVAATWNLVGHVSPHKTFDRLFYDQKQQLIELLKKFQSKTMYPSNIPMDNKLGILLYGPPGTGKTGTISAIANMLKLHMRVINFSVVRTRCNFDTKTV